MQHDILRKAERKTLGPRRGRIEIAEYGQRRTWLRCNILPHPRQTDLAGPNCSKVIAIRGHNQRDHHDTLETAYD
jgi:hypothetical protein